MSGYGFLRKPNARQWCPGFREHLVATYSRGTCSFLADLEPSIQSVHFNCTQESCNATNVGWRDYVTQHCQSNCTCDLVGPDPEEVKRLILSKKIPLLRLGYSANGSLKINVVAADFESRYVAVSHVWTGGMGNPRKNEVHLCQLEMIARMGKQIRHTIGEGMAPGFPNAFRRWRRRYVQQDFSLFWVDTLCIPVREFITNHDGSTSETARSKDLRGLAIDRMTHVYAGAHSVCVLDPELRSLPNELLNEDPERLFGLIVRCDWMRRCWTYQEAAMARRLFVMLQSGPLYLTRERFRLLRQTSEADWRDSTRRQRLMELTRWISELPAPRRSFEYDSRELITGTDPRAFAEVWNTLISRSTSHDGDRFLIFALMMNLVPGSLLKFENEARLKSIFGSLRSLPLDFLFDSAVGNVDYWLPGPNIERKLSGTCGHMKRDSFEVGELSFDRDDAMAGADRPGLWIFPGDFLTSRLFSTSTDGVEHAFELQSDQAVREDLSQSRYVALMVKDRSIIEPDDRGLEGMDGVLFNVIHRSEADDGTTTSWRLSRTCAVRCIRRVKYAGCAPVPLGDDLLLVGSHKFYIQCAFGKMTPLSQHRDLSDPLNPGFEVGIPQFMHFGAHLGIFYVVYTALVCAIALTPNPASFSWGFVFFISQFWGYQMVYQMLFIWFPSSRQGDRITYMQWIDGLTPDWPPALPKRLRGIIHVNYGPVQTCIRLFAGTLLTVVGIVYRRQRNVRWLVAWGLMIVLEVALRWVMELTYNYYWMVHHPESHVLVKEFLKESRLTRWCKRTFGWPRDLTEEQIVASRAAEPYWAQRY